MTKPPSNFNAKKDPARKWRYLPGSNRWKETVGPPCKVSESEPLQCKVSVKRLATDPCFMQRRKTESRRYYCFREGRALAIFIRRKIWEGTEKEPKTEARKAPIPIIPHLKKIIEQYRTSNGSPTTGWAFTASRGKKPTRMDNLARREIKPDLEKAKIAWHGWHAFRKSLGHQSL